MTPPFYEVLGIGTPIIDYIIEVSPNFLQELSGIKGGSMPIDYECFEKLIRQSKASPIKVIGGSSTNTIKGLARLGRTCALFGKIGKDEAGYLFRSEIERLNIVPYLPFSNLPTAQVACFIAPPEYERTMRSSLGASKDIKTEDLSEDMFKSVKIVHIEGYLMANGKLVNRAMELAKQAGAKISFDLSSVEIIEGHSTLLLDLINSYVDILFANEEETFALTGKTPEQGCEELRNLCEVTVVKMGKFGNWAANSMEKVYQPALKVNTADSTGAGDLFASGFLHGYLASKNLQTCSYYGATLAGEVVQIIGADIPEVLWPNIKERL